MTYKVQKSEYLSDGRFAVIDQSEREIAAYVDSDSGRNYDVPAVVFGDHTRRFKWVDQPFVPAADGVKVFSPASDCDPRFLYHSLLNLTIPDLGYSRHWAKVKALQITLPPLAEQKRIAGILDQMDALVNDLTSGLPAELEARRKQYAYYRDRLLTFKEKPQM